MAKARSATSEAIIRTLTSNAARAREMLAAHRKVCSDCRPGPDFARRACAEGWEMARAGSRADNDLSVYTAGSAAEQIPGQVPLW